RRTPCAARRRIPGTPSGRRPRTTGRPRAGGRTWCTRTGRWARQASKIHVWGGPVVGTPVRRVAMVTHSGVRRPVSNPKPHGEQNRTSVDDDAVDRPVMIVDGYPGHPLTRV